ncbi:hypothetical protein [Nesterenkonia sp. Act20]|uniref:hypothetical protein n=1 Tax=Nesterenkonia sp. Act20 TaxID=1483432 RepID=UPI001C4636E7|nr:hypothetical protein [Nesterenkonia sp. Act20]
MLIRLLGLLREIGSQTAAQLGDMVDEAPGTISYHLGKLASIGVIESAEPLSSDRRERWWKATDQLTRWEPAELLDDPEKLAASSQLQKSVAQAYAAMFSGYVDAIPGLPRDWVAAAATGDRSLRLTAAELSDMRSELESLVERWVRISEAHDVTTQEATDHDGAQPVALVYQAYRRA